MLELDDGRWGAFEIKLGVSQIDAAADTLIKTDRKIRNDNAENTPAFLAVVSGMTNAAYRKKRRGICPANHSAQTLISSAFPVSADL